MLVYLSARGLVYTGEVATFLALPHNLCAKLAHNLNATLCGDRNSLTRQLVFLVEELAAVQMQIYAFLDGIQRATKAEWLELVVPHGSNPSGGTHQHRGAARPL
ncbi:MAG: hypothetical protein WAX89_01145 [Alphaproteobacteria bacterium]